MMHSGAKRSLTVAILAAILLTPLLSWLVRAHSGSFFNQYYLGIAIDVAINIILAVSLNLINGHTGQFSLGHAGFMAVGGYTAAKFTLLLSASTPAWAHPLLFGAGLLLAGIMSAVVGLGVGLPSLRLRGDYLAIMTLGFGEVIRVVFQNTEFFGAATGLPGIANWTNFGWAWSLAALTVFVVACVVNSTFGRGFIAVHDDEIAASSMGINPVRYKVTAFVIGAFFAGIAGGLFAHHKRFLSPTSFDFMKSIDIVVMVILGGMGRTPGVILAAIILTVLPETLRGFQEYRMIIYSLLIIGLMILRPQGLFTIGKRTVKAS